MREIRERKCIIRKEAKVNVAKQGRFKKKKKKEKRKLLSALKTLGEATSCGGIFAQITLTPFPWTMFSTCVHFLHTLPQRSFFFFFYRFFFFWQNFCSWRKLRKSHQCVEIILLQSQMLPGSELAHQSVKSLWKHQNTQQRVSDRETVKSLLFQFKKKISESSLYPTLISENEMLVPDLSASCSLIIII